MPSRLCPIKGLGKARMRHRGRCTERRGSDAAPIAGTEPQRRMSASHGNQPTHARPISDSDLGSLNVARATRANDTCHEPRQYRKRRWRERRRRLAARRPGRSCPLIELTQTSVADATIAHSSAGFAMSPRSLAANPISQPDHPGEDRSRQRSPRRPIRQSAEVADQWPLDQACSCTTRSLSMAKTQRPSRNSRRSIRSGSM